VLGLYKPTSGSILIDGVDINQIDPATLRKNIGYVPQDIVLFFGSVKENITFAAPYADDAALVRAAEIAGVTEFVHPSAQGFDLHIGERGEGLSAGSARPWRSPARCCSTRPCLIMDEPTELARQPLGRKLQGEARQGDRRKDVPARDAPRLAALAGAAPDCAR
jgi:ATP-binding cassette subfamily C protein LapB